MFLFIECVSGRQTASAFQNKSVITVLPVGMALLENYWIQCELPGAGRLGGQRLLLLPPPTWCYFFEWASQKKCFRLFSVFCREISLNWVKYCPEIPGCKIQYFMRKCEYNLALFCLRQAAVEVELCAEHIVMAPNHPTCSL